MVFVAPRRARSRLQPNITSRLVTYCSSWNRDLISAASADSRNSSTAYCRSTRASSTVRPWLATSSSGYTPRRGGSGIPEARPGGARAEPDTAAPAPRPTGPGPVWSEGETSPFLHQPPLCIGTRSPSVATGTRTTSARKSGIAQVLSKPNTLSSVVTQTAPEINVRAAPLALPQRPPGRPKRAPRGTLFKN